MNFVVVGLLVLLILAGSTAVVMLPKAKQRAFCMLGLLFIVYSFVVLAQMKTQAWHYGQNIAPMRQVWEILDEEVDGWRSEEAQSYLQIIRTGWEKIGARSGTYSAMDILREIETNSEARGRSAPPDEIRRP